MNKCTMRGHSLCVWVQISPILIVYIVCAWFVVIITPSPKQRPSTISIGWEGGRTGRKGGALKGGGGTKVGVKGEGQGSLGPRWRGSGKAVQSDCPLPTG